MSIPLMKSELTKGFLCTVDESLTKKDKDTSTIFY